MKRGRGGVEDAVEVTTLPVQSSSKRVRSDAKYTDAQLLGEGTVLEGQNRYEVVKVLGKGSFGIVTSAKDKERGGKLVAVKRIETTTNYREFAGIPPDALREINFLTEIHHPNVLDLFDVYSNEKALHLVIEYCPFTLDHIIKSPKIVSSIADIKGIMKMMLEGLAAVHRNYIVHLDLKPENILFTPDGVLKLADFGLARRYGHPEVKLNPISITIFYRPPELLHGARFYGPPSDMWSVGCIFGEMLLRSALFPAMTEKEELQKIYSVLGTPTKENWPNFEHLPAPIQFEHTEPKPLSAIFSSAPSDAVDLLSKMLMLDPAKRITVEEALSHRFFSSHPQPSSPSEIVLPPRS